MDGWVKLYRKALLNNILKDQMAWTIFTWLLLKVDRYTGIKVTGRFWAAQELGIKPITFYKGLRRLEKKWQMVTLRVTGKSTEIKIINWYKYQNSNTSGNTSITHEEHIGNTLQEVENRELRSIHDSANADRVTNSPKTKNKCPNILEGHKGCLEYIDSLAKQWGGKFPNYAREINALHKLLKA